MSASLPRATETGLGRVAQWPRLSPTSPVRALLLSVFKAHLGLQAPGILHLQAGKQAHLPAGSHPLGILSVSSFSLIYFVK